MRRIEKTAPTEYDLDVFLQLNAEYEARRVIVAEYAEWTGLAHPRVRRLVTDLRDQASADRLARRFDVVVSSSVLEHVRHPHAALCGLKTVLKPGGTAWLTINLHRGPLASHR